MMVKILLRMKKICLRLALQLCHLTFSRKDEDTLEDESDEGENIIEEESDDCEDTLEDEDYDVGNSLANKNDEGEDIIKEERDDGKDTVADEKRFALGLLCSFAT